MTPSHETSRWTSSSTSAITFYEYGPDSYGGETGATLGRVHAPAKEIVTLEDYRQRHGQYKSDAGSLLMHAAHPLVAIWDDHESANNPWMGGAENHQPGAEGPGGRAGKLRSRPITNGCPFATLPPRRRGRTTGATSALAVWRASSPWKPATRAAPSKLITEPTP